MNVGQTNKCMSASFLQPGLEDFYGLEDMKVPGKVQMNKCTSASSPQPGLEDFPGLEDMKALVLVVLRRRDKWCRRLYEVLMYLTFKKCL